MESVKVLHIADIHIGRKYANLDGRKSRARASEVILTLEKTLADFSQAQIVLLSGDIFEGDAPLEVVDFLNNLFARHKDKFFFMSCGNHDCYESSIIKSLCLNLPENVTVFSDKMERVVIESLKTIVYGVSFAAPFSYASLLSGFSVNDEYISIMVMHADTESNSRYNPITSDEISKSGLDYLALGHIHSFSGILKIGSVTYAYPGVLEPGGFDETGECGVIFGEVFKKGTSLGFYPVSARKYHHLIHDITGFSSHEQVISSLQNIITKDDFYKVELIGTPNFSKPDIPLYEDVIDAYYIKFIDNCKGADSILNYCQENSLRGKTALALMEFKNSCDEDVFGESCDILTNLLCKD